LVGIDRRTEFDFLDSFTKRSESFGEDGLVLSVTLSMDGIVSLFRRFERVTGIHPCKHKTFRVFLTVERDIFNSTRIFWSESEITTT
jgi:hypothetical protein